MKMVRILLSSAVGVLFASLEFLVEWYAQTESFLYTVADYAWIPGATLAKLIYPAGIHTGMGSGHFVPLATALNFLVYTGLTFLLICTLPSRKQQSSVNWRDSSQ